MRFRTNIQPKLTPAPGLGGMALYRHALRLR